MLSSSSSLVLLLLVPILARAQICEICGCSACPEGFRVSNGDEILDIPPEYQSLALGRTQASCSLIETVGLQGLIPAEFCNTLQQEDNLRQVCGCPTVPNPSPARAPVEITTPMPVVSAPTSRQSADTDYPTTVPTPAVPYNTNGIVEFILVHAPTNTELLRLQDKDIIELKDLGVDTAAFNIKVNVDESLVRSVYFSETDREESVPPFAFCGDDMGEYFVCDEIEIGKKVKVTVTPYTGEFLTGSELPEESISFTIMSTAKGEKENKSSRGEGKRTPSKSPPTASPSVASAPITSPPVTSKCDTLSFLGKVDLFMVMLNERIDKTGFPNIKLDFVSGDADDGSCALQIHFGLSLKAKLFDNDVELGGSGVLAGIAIGRDDSLACVDNLHVTEITMDGAIADILLDLVERNVLEKTVPEIITGALDRFDFCIDK